MLRERTVVASDECAIFSGAQGRVVATAFLMRTRCVYLAIRPRTYGTSKFDYYAMITIGSLFILFSLNSFAEKIICFSFFTIRFHLRLIYNIIMFAKTCNRVQ